MWLKGQVGLLQATAIGVGGTIGGGIFTLIGVAAGKAGPAALLSFILSCLAALLLGLCYAELSSRLPRIGGGYAFVREAFGPTAGFIMGWAYWGGYLIASGYVTLGFGGYLEQLTGLPRVPAAVGLVIILALLNLRGVRVSSRFQTLLVAFEVIALFVIAGIGSAHANPVLLGPFMPQGWSGIIAASLVAFLAFGGFDQVAAMGDEVHEPRRTLPRAILASLLIVLTLYLGLLYAALGNVPWQELSASTAPLALAAQEFLGGGVAVAVPLLALVATTATANALVLVTSRVLFAMAADGLVPRILGRATGRQRVPVLAIVVSAAGMALVAGGGNLSLVVDATGFLYAGGFILALAAYFRLRQRGTGSAAAFTVPAYPWVPLAAFLLTSVVLIQAQSGALVGMIWLILGGAVHVLMQLSKPGRERSVI